MIDQSVHDCTYASFFNILAGYEGHPFQFISGSIPEIFTLPGTATISYHAKRVTDLPADLVMGLKLKKVGPVEHDIPCIAGSGSW